MPFNIADSGVEMAVPISDWLRNSPLLARLRAARAVLAAAVLVFGALWAVGVLSVAWTLAALAVIVVVALISAPTTNLARADGAIEAILPPGPHPIDAVLAGLPQPVIALDHQAQVIAFNAPASTIAPALRRAEPVTLGLRVPEVLDAIRRAIASGAPQRVEFIERVPVERWHEAIVAPIAFPSARQGPAARIVLVTFDDLTPLRRVEEMRADFVANASHELRTPLAALSGFIETLQGSARDDAEARSRFLIIMQAQATRMARLIDDLLSLSRIELNAYVRPDKPVELRAIVRQVVDGLQTLARDREVDVSIMASPDRIVVLGDRDELLRVFENLVENALKYAASGKRLDLSLTSDSRRGEARVTVRDYGPGIAPEHLPRLTERFYRVDVADSRAQGGTGLGLALVKHILNRHGGRLTIESIAGQGATFTAHIPLANPENS